MKYNKYFTKYDEWLIFITLNAVGYGEGIDKADDLIRKVIKPHIERFKKNVYYGVATQKHL